MNDEDINKLFSAMMGKQEEEIKPFCPNCGNVRTYYFSPSIDGEATKEVRDWMTKEMPEEWELYLSKIEYEQGGIGGLNDDTLSIRILNAQLSITNLAQYIVKNQEMFYEECDYCTKFGRLKHKIIKPQFAEAVRVIEEEKKK